MGTPSTHAGYTLSVVSSEDPVQAFAESVARGLDLVPRRLEPRWLYDERGSRLFEAITRMPEYPLHRAEDALLRAHAATLAELVGAPTLVELGSGTSSKTRRLLDALVPRGARRYVAVDVSASALDAGCAALARRYPSLRVEGRVGTFEDGLARLPDGGPTLLSFLGSTLGNLTPTETDVFLARAHESLSRGDHLLLGVDGVKPAEALIRAYDDPGGLTAAFVLNVFRRMNRELGAGVPLDALRLVTRWDPEAEQVEMLARFERSCALAIPRLGRSWRLSRGEEVLVEISRKFRPMDLAAVAAGHGFGLRRLFEHADAAFALLLLRRL